MSEILTPDTALVQTATLRALKDRVGEDEVNRFLESAVGVGVPAPLGATASLTFAAIYGVVKCEPRNQPWLFDADVWGAGAAAISSVGFMYTAYESWDAFFTQTTAFHVQGVAEAGGFSRSTGSTRAACRSASSTGPQGVSRCSRPAAAAGGKGCRLIAPSRPI